MQSLNKVQLIGTVGKEPEIRTFQNGGKLANFSVATSERWKDKATQEYKEKTEWHRVSILSDAVVGIVEKYVHKGSKVFIEGQLETRKWSDKDGIERYLTEVVLRPYSGQIILLNKVEPPKQQEIDDEVPF